MNFLKNLLYFSIVAAMLILGALFAVQNTATVPLDLLVIYFPARSIALWVLLAFALGGVIGMLTSIGLILRLRTALLRANRQLAKQSSAAQAATVAVESATATEPTETKEN